MLACKSASQIPEKTRFNICRLSDISLLMAAIEHFQKDLTL